MDLGLLVFEDSNRGRDIAFPPCFSLSFGGYARVSVVVVLDLVLPERGRELGEVDRMP